MTEIQAILQQMMTWTNVMAMVGGYLLGSISAAIIVCRLLGLADPRTVGSHNPGATNVLRHGGRKAAAATLLGDMLKGLIAVLIALWLTADEISMGIAGFGAFLGHLYPVFFRFSGGKGVATFFGALLGIDWMAGLAALACWLVIAKVFRISSLAALITAIFVPGMLFYLGSADAVVAISIIMSVLLIWRHRSNIHNLLEGTEGRISADKTSED